VVFTHELKETSLRTTSRAGVVMTGLVCAGLLSGLVTPAWAGDGDDRGDQGSPVVGAFGVGDGLEAAVDERDGSARFALSVAGLQLTWDSKGAGGEDRTGFGPAWGLGTALMGTNGGTQVYTASGGGPYTPDPTHPSGLAGYGVEDVVFEQAEGTVPGRAIEPGPGIPERDAEVAYAYVLRELGGAVTYFDAAGDPVMRTTALDERTDWLWDRLVPHRLLGVVSPDGVVTTLDWESEPGAVVVTQGANLPGETDPVSGETGDVPVWRVELDGGRVSAVVDPVGGRTDVEYDDHSGLVAGLSGASGATTHVAWRVTDDGVARVARVRATDATGHELSVREWTPDGDGTTSSGWPAYGGEGELFWSGDPAFRYRTAMTDGATRVVSEYNSQHILVDRRMVVTTPSGELTLQEQAFSYPGTEGGGVGDPDALPGNWSRPTAIEITHRDSAGATRSVTETTEFDALGRESARTAADGTVTRNDYDPVVPGTGPLPIGLVVAETVTAPDGLVRQTRHTLNDERTAVVVTEQWEGRPADGEPGEPGAPGEPGDAPPAGLVRTARIEYDVAADGFVTAERRYPGGDAAATPVTTAWDSTVDLGAGTLTSTETRAAGTPVAATVTEVTNLRHGGVVAATDPVGNTTRTGHDALGRPTASITQAGLVTMRDVETAQRDGRNATTTTGPDGVAVTEVSDEIGRLVRVTDNIDHGEAVPGFVHVVSSRAYPDPGTVQVTDAWGATTTTRQDVLGRTVATTGPTGLTEIADHDDVAGTVTTGVTTTGSLADAERTVTQTKDVSGRVVSSAGERSDGAPVPELAAEYDGLGRTTSATGAALTTDIEYDERGNPVSTALTGIDRDDTMTATRRFDGFGESLEKTLAADGEARTGSVRTLDPRGRVQHETDQLGRVSTFEYTPDGLVSRAASGSGQLVERTYDPVSRTLLEEVVSSPVGETVRTAYEYDPATGLKTASYDPADRAGTEIATTYDAHRNPATVRYPDGSELSFAYDEHGRRTGMTDVSGHVTTLTHTPAGLITSAVQRDGDGALLAEVSSEYDDHGRLSRVTRGNGTSTEYTFTSASEIETETTTAADGVVVAARAYRYDPRGNLLERTDTTRDPGAQPATETTTYEYDSFDRLIRSAVRDGAASATVTTEYDLSVSGDIRAETTTESPGAADETRTVRAFEYSPLGELVAETTSTRTGADPAAEVVVRREQAYDVAGNLTHAADGTRYAYDAMNRPVTQTTSGAVATETRYWADHTRREIAVTDPATGAVDSTGFYWDGTTLVNETHASTGQVESTEIGTAAYLLGSGRHARITVDGDGRVLPSYYVADRHGNVTELLDGAGQVSTRYRYSDYGVASATGVSAPVAEAGLGRNPFGYAGEFTDADGTQYLQTRIYHPHDHRFTTSDIAELHNLYAFADLNPIMRIDPSGRNGEWDWFSIINAVMVGVSVVLAAVGIGELVLLTRFVAHAAVVMASNQASIVARAAAGTVGKVSKWDWVATIFGVSMEVGGAGLSGFLLANEHADSVIDDEQILEYFMWAEAISGAGAFLTGFVAARALNKAARLDRALNPKPVQPKLAKDRPQLGRNGQLLSRDTEESSSLWGGGNVPDSQAQTNTTNSMSTTNGTSTTSGPGRTIANIKSDIGAACFPLFSCTEATDKGKAAAFDLLSWKTTFTGKGAPETVEKSLDTMQGHLNTIKTQYPAIVLNGQQMNVIDLLQQYLNELRLLSS
jgi:RHS repeat-associated protein